jgi:hypothetical protein
VDHDPHGLLGLPDRRQHRLFAWRSGGRDEVRRTRRHALSCRHRHDAEGGLRAAVHRLAGLRHRLEGRLAAFIATFPIIVSTAAGFYAASENERMLFKAMGASRWQTLVRLKLPTGLPYIFTGLKIAAVGVMAGAITGEFLGGGKGFGALIRESASMLDTPRVFSLILYLSLLALPFSFLSPGCKNVWYSGTRLTGRVELGDECH